MLEIKGTIMYINVLNAIHVLLLTCIAVKSRIITVLIGSQTATALSCNSTHSRTSHVAGIDLDTVPLAACFLPRSVNQVRSNPTTPSSSHPWQHAWLGSFDTWQLARMHRSLTLDAAVAIEMASTER